MNIALRKTSLTDYPGKVSSVFFFPFCNLRCPWCHNPELVLGVSGGPEKFISLNEGLAHLHKRRSVLGGAVLSGGEPCLYKELGGLIREIKKLPLPVKLDTNGMCPDMLEELLGSGETSPDYIALDLKIAPERYAELLPPVENGKKSLPALLNRSAKLVRHSGIAHEYRSLVLPGGFITEEDIKALSPLADDGPWHFRPFRGGNCLDPAWNSLEESAETAQEQAKTLCAKAMELGKNAVCSV